jgi:excisionase family DNA binding protein
MVTSPTLQPRTYSVTEVARIFGVTPSHVSRLCQRGEIPSIRLGGRLLIPRTAVDQILASAADEQGAAS